MLPNHLAILTSFIAFYKLVIIVKLFIRIMYEQYNLLLLKIFICFDAHDSEYFIT